MRQVQEEPSGMNLLSCRYSFKANVKSGYSGLPVYDTGQIRGVTESSHENGGIGALGDHLMGRRCSRQWTRFHPTVGQAVLSYQHDSLTVKEHRSPSGCHLRI